MLEMALVENVQREELNALERAQGFHRLLEEFSMTVTEISKRIGKSPAYVSNTLRLLALPDAIKDGLISNDITEGHARAILGLGDPKLMVEAYKTVLSEGASVRRTEDLSRRIKEEQNIPARNITKEKIYSVEIETMAKDLSKKLNATVRITQSTVSAQIKVLFKGAPEVTTDLMKAIYQKLTEAYTEAELSSPQPVSANT